jgi:diguanylate cyclase (GGDEF)-like protein
MTLKKKEIASFGLLDRFWTVTNFHESGLNTFARDILKKETRTGIQLMTLVFFFLLVVAAFLDRLVGLGGPSSYAYLVLAVLSLHVLLASRHSHELDVLYLLAISLLMISSTTLVLLAHKSGTFSPTFYAGVALIFIFIPFVPWGLREASLVSFLIYLVITLSILRPNHNFTSDSIILLQFFMLSTATIVLTMVGKNTDVRRNEIMGLYGLQKSHAEMQLLSYKDPLTDTWNRRYLQEKFYTIAGKLSQSKKPYHFILFDIDEFKEINDTYGHDYGDHILQWVAESFNKTLNPGDYIFRIGGDEFAMIIGADEPLQNLQAGIRELASDVEKIGKIDHAGVALSFGMSTVLQEQQPGLREIYKMTDKALYAAKRQKGNWLVAGDISDPDLNQSLDTTFDATHLSGEKG